MDNVIITKFQYIYRSLQIALFLLNDYVAKLISEMIIPFFWCEGYWACIQNYCLCPTFPTR
jgi:hypothetical protein